jgi:hypothetical protein
MISTIASKYNHYAAHFPFITNAVTGFAVASAGDIFCQKYLENNLKNSIEFSECESNSNTVIISRSVELGLIRSFLITPFIIKWYPFLARISPGRNTTSVVKILLVDQFVGSPIVILMVFVAKAAIHDELNSVVHKIEQNFFATWITGFCYWPFVHSITFSVVPMVHQPLFAHIASIYWNAVLSFYANKN